MVIKSQKVPLSVPTGPSDRARDGWANFEGNTGYEQEVSFFHCMYVGVTTVLLQFERFRALQLRGSFEYDYHSFRPALPVARKIKSRDRM